MENSTPAPATPQDPSEIPAEERLFAALGYIPLLFVLPSAFKPKSAFCQKHAKQGMILSGSFFVTLLIMAIIPSLGLLLFLGLLALIVIGAIKAHSGQESSLPGLAKLAIPGKSKAESPAAPPAAPAVAPSAQAPASTPPSTPSVAQAPATPAPAATPPPTTPASPTKLAEPTPPPPPPPPPPAPTNN